MLVLNIESGPNERYTHDLSKFLENRFKGWNRNPRFEILHACVSPLILFLDTKERVHRRLSSDLLRRCAFES